MDTIRLGQSLRALRLRRGWTQAELGERAACSRSQVSAIERGSGDALTCRALGRIVSELGARLSVRVLWHGEDLDRLLDQRHAALIEAGIRRLATDRWEAMPEATYAIGGERGSIDILAWRRSPDHLLVVEVKSVVPDIQATLAGLDRKARIAPQVARERGLPAGSVSRLLVIADSTTTRRRVGAVSATFAAAYPDRGVAVRHWLANPIGRMAGIVFLPDVGHRVDRRRGRRARPGPTPSATRPQRPRPVSCTQRRTSGRNSSPNDTLG